MVWRAPGGSTADDFPGSTRPLPQRQARPPSRSRRYLKRAAFTLATLAALFVLAAGALFLVTPSAGEATRQAS